MARGQRDGFSTWMMLGVVTGLLLLGRIGQAVAQSDIPSDIKTTTSALTPQQIGVVETAIDALLKKMADAPDAQVLVSRVQVVDPLGGAVQGGFRRIYPSLVIGGLLKQGGPLASDRVIVRLNAMILAADLIEGSNDPLPIIRAGLADQKPGAEAVHYWAVTAAERAGRKGSLTAEQDEQLRELLTTLVKGHPNPQVVAGALMAMTQLDMVKGIPALLSVLNTRVAMHLDQPALPLTPDLDALAELYRRIVTERARNPGNVPDALIRQLGSVSFRYLLLPTRLATAGKVDGSRRDLVETVSTTEVILKWVQEKLAPTDKQAESMAVFASSNRWKEVLRVSLNHWQEVLKAEPFNLKPEELKVELK